MTAKTFNRITSEEVIVAIRAARAEGLTMQAVADRFRVSISVVHKVCSGRELAGLPPLPRNDTAAGCSPAAGRHDGPTA